MLKNTQGRAEGGTTPTTVGGPGPKGGPRQGQIKNKKKIEKEKKKAD